MGIATTDKGLMTELIVDGKLLKENLETLHIDKKWLNDELHKNNVDSIKRVLLAGIQSDGELYISLKN